MAQSEASTAKSCPSLKQRLITANLDHLLPKLEENEIATIDMFTKLNETELNSLCDKLELNEEDKEKLKQLHQKQVNSNKLSPPMTKRSTKTSTKANDNNLPQINDMQHILEQYFTEIEGGCNNAKQAIDQKFQEIIAALTSKQKQLHQRIDEWKLNQLENVNKEISNIMQYKEECKDNAESKDNTNEDDDKYEKYRNPQKLSKHIEDITPLISIDIDPTCDNNITNAVPSLISIGSKKYVSFPSIILTKPTNFMDKNDGYSTRLKFKFKNYVGNINKDLIICKYKVATNSNDDEKKNDDDDNPDNPWYMFRHGTIADVRGEDEIVMQTQLLNVLKPNQTYLCQIEFPIKKPIDFLVESNIVQFINIKEESKKELNKIKLEYHSHRKHSLTRHPKNLLLNSDTKQYWSAFNNDFGRDESDWIIFKYKETKNWIPKQIIFKNYKSNQDVKRMIVYIGNTKNKEWFPLTKQAIQPNLSKDLQYFDVDNFDEKLAEDERYKFIKLEFLENYGETNPDMCKFCCRHFTLMAIN